MKSISPFYSPIGPTIARYIELKRSLGRSYAREYNIFKQLDKFLNTLKSDLNAENFETWCHTQQYLSSGSRRKKMQKIYQLCLYRQRMEPSCFIPNPSLFPIKHQPIQPHIFTENEVVGLYNEIEKMKSSHISPFRQENFRLGLILLYTTGLRLGELVRLTIGDYDATEHLLLIRESKFHKSRIIPLSKDAWNAIEDHLKIQKNRCSPISKELPLLLHNNHVGKLRSYIPSNYSTVFNHLFRASNIRKPDGSFPRLHDFRHSFAVNALLRWYREGVDVQSKLPMLSTYMGHCSVVSTHYYLRFIEPVIEKASTCFEKHYSSLISLI